MDADKPQLPEISAAASWVDNFKLPMREIRKRYTLSELALLSWNSRQQVHLMRSRVNTNTDAPAQTGPVQETDSSYLLPSGVNNNVPVPKKLINQEGELDLSLATGPEACRYLQSLGIPIMMF